MKLTTAGESHGKALVAIIEGLPAHLQIDIEKINETLVLRQSGYGRGARQKIERDRVEILTGVRDCETLGSPVTLCIYNKDYANWENCMSDGDCDKVRMQEKALTKVRPGHADLTGMLKFEQSDARNILERASARETAIRVAAGGVYKQYLSALGVEIGGYVCEVCGVKDEGVYAFNELKKAKTTQLGMLNESLEARAVEKIAQLKKEGDTAGGVVEIRVKGLKSGFGSMMTYAEKLDGQLAQGLMSIQAVKGVEVGAGFSVASTSGRDIHDEIFYDETRGIYRKTNRAGGIEGGMSNGEEIVLRVAMKPIPTLMKGLQTVDFATKERAVAASERSDVCAIFALEIIAEAVVAEVLANAIEKRLGGDTMHEVKVRYDLLP
ncbi:MAG: chorismate synthase [Clostridiales bacterium]|nr:chorismate synthase [Clostridiales bacterium]